MFLWCRALLYMLLVGGSWFVVLPGVILFLEQGELRAELRSASFMVPAALQFVVGAVLALASGYHLIAVGRGTPFPLDPTRILVTSGPYRRIRNPQGVAMLLMTIAVVLSVHSAALWVMLPLTLFYLEVIVGPMEERQLARNYGPDYVNYKQRVRKWIPRTLRDN